MKNFRKATINSVGIVGIPGYRVIDDAVTDIEHPCIVDVNVGLQAAGRESAAAVSRVIDIDPPAAEFAMLEREAHLIFIAVRKIEDVIVRIDPVAKQIDAMQQEMPEVRELKGTVGDGTFRIGIFGFVRSPGAFCFLGDDIVHQIVRRRHAHQEQVVNLRIGAVRNRHGSCLIGPANDVASIRFKRIGSGRKIFQCQSRSRAVPSDGN